MRSFCHILRFDNFKDTLFGWYIPMMYLAFWMAARAQSTLGPSVQKPWLSGGLTWIRAMSSCQILRRNRFGISLRNTGVKSALPAFTASRQLAPMKRELLRKMPVERWKYNDDDELNSWPRNHWNCWTSPVIPHQYVNWEGIRFNKVQWHWRTCAKL